MVAAVQFRDIGVTGINSFVPFVFHLRGNKACKYKYREKKETKKKNFSNNRTLFDIVLGRDIRTSGIIQKFRVGPSFSHLTYN